MRVFGESITRCRNKNPICKCLGQLSHFPRLLALFVLRLIFSLTINLGFLFSGFGVWGVLGLTLSLGSAEEARTCLVSAVVITAFMSPGSPYAPLLALRPMFTLTID